MPSVSDLRNSYTGAVDRVAGAVVPVSPVRIDPDLLELVAGKDHRRRREHTA